MMLDIAEQLIEKWERLNPDEDIDVPGRHDPADARHDRPVRIRLPLQLVLPRQAAPVRRRDGPAPCTRPRCRARELPDAEPMLVRAPPPARARHRAHERPWSTGSSASAGPTATALAHKHDLLEPHAHRRGQADRRTAARREHPHQMHHVPDRRPRDDQRPAVVRPLLPAEAPRGAGAGARARSTRSSARTRGAPPTHAQVASAALRHSRSSRRRCGSGRPRPRSPASRTRTRRSAGTYPAEQPRSSLLIADAAPRPDDLGPGRRGRSTPTTSPRRRGASLPPNAFKPFGNGQRACIGRQFAMQEAALVLGMLLQQFELDRLRHYQLRSRRR